jgi:excisionase family DNA binding protein
MAGRGRSSLTSRKPARSSKAARVPAPVPRALLYTAQDVARFCEVDLKTIHHWADGGKIPHHRTEGRHLRFRRNHVLSFLRHHGYPIAAELASVRPTVFFALALDELAKKLGTRFAVRRFESALAAIAHLVAGEPDALVVSLDDPTWNGAVAVRTLKKHAETAWPALVLVTEDTARAGELSDAGADLVVTAGDLGRLSGELARTLGVD